MDGASARPDHAPRTSAHTSSPSVSTPMSASSRTLESHGRSSAAGVACGWALDLSASSGPLLLDDDCPGAVNRLVLCAELVATLRLATRTPSCPAPGHLRTRVDARSPRLRQCRRERSQWHRARSVQRVPPGAPRRPPVPHGAPGAPPATMQAEAVGT